jgi:hypothetical protein
MTPRETRSALVVIALLLPSLAAIFWSSTKAAGIPRPGAVRSFVVDGRDHAAVMFNGALHLLDAQGRRLTRQPLAELGLAAEPADMDWTADAQGKVHAWFFDDTVPRLVRCELDTSALFRAERCGTAMSGPQLKIQPASRAVHIAVDAARERVFIADAKGHAVRAFTLQGRLLAQGGDGDLSFPGRLRVAGNQLIVADNDHGRLVWMDIGTPEPSLLMLHTLAIDHHPEATGDRKAADFAVLPGSKAKAGALWLLAVKQGQKSGEVLVYGPGLEPTVSADLGGHGDPLVVDRLGKDLLVADLRGVALYRVSANGTFLGSFGNAQFARELAETRASLRAVEVWQVAGWAALAITLAIGFLLAWRFSETPAGLRALEAFDVHRDTEASVPLGPMDLKPAAWHRRQLAAVGMGASFVSLTLVGAVLFLFPYELPPGFWRPPMAWILPAVLLAMVVSAWFGLRKTARKRLWLARGRVEVRLERRTLAAAKPDEILASPRALLVGRQMLPYRIQGVSGAPTRWIYEEDLVKRYVLAHLRPQQRLTDAELARAYIVRMPQWQIAVAAMALSVAFVYFARDWLP